MLTVPFGAEPADSVLGFVESAVAAGHVIDVEGASMMMEQACQVNGPTSIFFSKCEVLFGERQPQPTHIPPHSPPGTSTHLHSPPPYDRQRSATSSSMPWIESSRSRAWGRYRCLLAMTRRLESPTSFTRRARPVS